MTDDEFISAIRKLGVGILSKKAAELVKRPSNRAEVRAYERRLTLQKVLDKTKCEARKTTNQEKASK